jgi:predicted DNA-binding antitoxin AbrB/MazE fold protein
MEMTIEATYENGVLKPASPLPLAEHERVRVTLERQVGGARRTAGMLGWTGDPEMLHRLAEDPEFGVTES